MQSDVIRNAHFLAREECRAFSYLSNVENYQWILYESNTGNWCVYFLFSKFVNDPRFRSLSMYKIQYLIIVLPGTLQTYIIVLLHIENDILHDYT